MYRRSFLTSGTLAFLGFDLRSVGELVSAAPLSTNTVDTTLDAFADTLIPGEKRHSGDVAVAGAAAGPSGASAGFRTLLMAMDLGMTLGAISTLLNARATAYALTHGILLPPGLMPFVALRYRDRTAVVSRLFQPSDLDRDLWVVMALLSSLAFDAAAQMTTVDAIRLGHPGLTYLDFPTPDNDGLWRYADYSYRTVLADEHPRTTPGGQPV